MIERWIKGAYVCRKVTLSVSLIFFLIVSMVKPVNAADSDFDGVDDELDNCPNDSNASQSDVDDDGVGDICDNCLLLKNASQSNHDNDLQGDECDADDDDDGVLDTDPDDCPTGDTGWVSGAATDYDSDGCRDSGVEDADDDNDGVIDSSDSCPRGDTDWLSDSEGTDIDVDGCRDDSEDTCVDVDMDEYGDPPFSISGCSGTTGPEPATLVYDNCPSDSNPSQLDTDGDGVGDVCEEISPPKPPVLFID